MAQTATSAGNSEEAVEQNASPVTAEFTKTRIAGDTSEYAEKATSTATTGENDEKSEDGTAEYALEATSATTSHKNLTGTKFKMTRLTAFPTFSVKTSM